MPDLDRILQAPRVQVGGNAQVFEARVTRITPDGAHVVIPGFDRLLEWGPCSPPGASVAPGDLIAVAMSEQGRPWIVSH